MRSIPGQFAFVSTKVRFVDLIGFSAARTRSPQELVIHSPSHPNRTTQLSSDLVSLVAWSRIQLARPCFPSRSISHTDVFPPQLRW